MRGVRISCFYCRLKTNWVHGEAYIKEFRCRTAFTDQ